MNETTQAIPPIFEPKPDRGVFGTRIPALTCFIVGTLLFLLPFAEVKCNSASLVNNTGLGIALGNDWKPTPGSLFANDAFSGGTQETKSTNKKQDPNILAIIALALGVVGIALCFINASAGIKAAMVSGALAAIALIALFIDLKNKVKDSAKESSGTNELDNSMRITLEFTHWYYIAVAAFIVASIFCYKRLK